MGNKSSLMLQDEEIKQIGEETRFSASQIEKLYSRFAHLDRSNCGFLSKNDLLSIPELATNPLCDRLIQIFFSDCDQEDERINFKQFIKVLALFRSNDNSKKRNSKCTNGFHLENYSSQSQNSPITRNVLNLQSLTVEKSTSNSINNKSEITSDKLLDEGPKTKLLFVFKVYDADDDGKISFNDLRSILKMMVGNYIEDVQLDKIATRAFVEVDEDSDGFIEFSEFCKVFSAEDLDDKLRIKFFN